MDNFEIPVILTRKKIRNLHMRVKADGIHISAPTYAKDREIEQFYKSNKAKMLPIYLELVAKQKAVAKELETGDFLWFNGEQYMIQLNQTMQNNVTYNGVSITINHKSNSNPKLLIEKFYKEQLLIEIDRFAASYFPLFIELAIPDVESITIRKMTSR